MSRDETESTINRDNPEDYGWAMAKFWLEDRKTHDPRRMRSGQSKGPLKMWLCDSCRITKYTTDLTPPTCNGGN